MKMKISLCALRVTIWHTLNALKITLKLHDTLLALQDTHWFCPNVTMTALNRYKHLIGSLAPLKMFKMTLSSLCR